MIYPLNLIFTSRGTEEPVHDGGKDHDAEKQLGKEDVSDANKEGDANKENPVTEPEEKKEPEVKVNTSLIINCSLNPFSWIATLFMNEFERESLMFENFKPSVKI